MIYSISKALYHVERIKELQQGKPISPTLLQVDLEAYNSDYILSCHDNCMISSVDLDRFWSKVDKTPTCWNWTAGKYVDGYGIFGFNGGVVRSHRFSFEIVNGKIPTNHEIHHKCKNKLCVNPEHLEAITHKNHQRLYNNLIKSQLTRTYCPQGHEYNKKNTYVYHKSGSRYCRICRNKYANLSHKKGGG